MNGYNFLPFVLFYVLLVAVINAGIVRRLMVFVDEVVKENVEANDLDFDQVRAVKAFLSVCITIFVSLICILLSCLVMEVDSLNCIQMVCLFIMAWYETQWILNKD